MATAVAHAAVCFEVQKGTTCFHAELCNTITDHAWVQRQHDLIALNMMPLRTMFQWEC